jgi:PKD repeat protein
LWERKTTGSYSTFSTSQNPAVSWDAGIYDVKLTATNAAGSDAEEKLDHIAIAAVFAPSSETVGTSAEVGLTTEILLAAADIVTTTDSVSMNTGTEFLVGEDTVSTADSADLETAILMESTDTATTSDTATLTVPPTIVLVPPTGGATAQTDLNVGGVDKPAIPPTTDLPLAIIRILDPMKQNIEIITGRRGGKIEALADGATLEEVVTKVNLIVARLMQ